MASFRTHISFGIAAGVLGAGVLSSLIASHAPGFLITIFAIATLGSVLPDIDSDSGLPFHVAFGSLTLVICAWVFARFYALNPEDLKVTVGYTAAAGVFVWGFVGYLFRRFTVHRGMAHSIPAALLSALATFFLASRFYFSDQEAFILAVAMLVGFLIHLILDEIWALVNFQGTPFIPNKAFGTAIKLFSESGLINFVVYGIIITLIYANYPRLYTLTENFLSTIRK
jgi:membrane-bound metal-dependent hydrolase YbcI (DUF457 family)